MASSIKNYLANTSQYLRLDYRLNRKSSLITTCVCAVSSIALTLLFQQKGLLGAGLITLVALSRRVSHIASTNRSTIPPFLQNELPLYAAPTLHEIVLHRPERLNSFLNGLQQTMRLKDELSNAQTDRRLTALHVAVLAQNLCAIELLVDRGASLLAQDNMGCTPLHLAVIAGNAEVLQKLEALAERRGVDYQSIKERYGATVSDLKRICSDPKVPGEQVVTSLQNGSGTLTPVTAARYKALTGTNYCNYVQMTTCQLLAQWRDQANGAIPNDAGEQAAVEKFLKGKPKGVLTENAKTGFGVHASEDLEIGDLAFKYGGEAVDPNNPRASNYRLGNIECNKNSNLSSRINDGFPRLYFDNVIGLGSSEEMGLIVSYKTPANTELTIDYASWHPCKYDRYVLVDEEILRTFPWEKALLACLENQFTTNSYLDRVKKNALFAPLSYLLNTPKALIFTLYSNILSLDDLKALDDLVQKDEAEKDGFDELLDEYRNKLIGIYSTLAEKNDPKYTLAVNGFIKNVFHKYRVIIGMYQIRQLAKTLSEEYDLYDKNPADWQAKMDKYENKLQLLDNFLDIAKDFTNPEKKISATKAFEDIVKQLKADNYSNVLLQNVVLFPLGNDEFKAVRDYLTEKYPEPVSTS